MFNISSQIRTLQSDVDDIFEQLAPRDSPSFTGNVSGIDKTMVGLGYVDNTSDANKPISTKTKTRWMIKRMQPIYQDADRSEDC